MAVVEGTEKIEAGPAEGMTPARQRERTARLAVFAVIPPLTVTAWSVLESNSLGGAVLFRDTAAGPYIDPVAILPRPLAVPAGPRLMAVAA